MSTMIATAPVADMLTRIRNAAAVNKHEITLPHSKFKQAVAEVLKANKYVDDVKAAGEGKDKVLTITINGELENARFTEVKMLSTPGRRMYVGMGEIPTVKHGRGIVIVSTSKGLLTGTQAKAQGLGGELLCQIF